MTEREQHNPSGAPASGDGRIRAGHHSANRLSLSTETLGFIIIKAREFDAKVAPYESDPGSNPSDDGDSEILSDQPDDATTAELVDAINELNEDEQIELVALAWLGRGDFTAREWPDAVALAADRHNRRVAAYLIGLPMLAEYLEEGLSQLGRSIGEVERDRL